MCGSCHTFMMVIIHDNLETLMGSEKVISSNGYKFYGNIFSSRYIIHTIGKRIWKDTQIKFIKL
jgi:hypothetical protein